jgi:hypothetical protein
MVASSAGKREYRDRGRGTAGSREQTRKKKPVTRDE